MAVEIYACRGCNYTQTTKWKGRCPHCGTYWSVVTKHAADKANPDGVRAEIEAGEVVALGDIAEDAEEVERYLIGGKFTAIDKLFGGDPTQGGTPGIASGSMTLLAGDAGIGKSTLTLQLLQSLARRLRVLYVSGEESLKQLAMRSKRIGKFNKKLLCVQEKDLDEILDKVDDLQPHIVVIDSLQALAVDESLRPASAASISEAIRIIEDHCRSTGVTYILIGHVDKEGDIAGPNSGLIHGVDVVLEFKGVKELTPRFLKCPSKNRWGPTGPLCFVQFEMGKRGLVVVEKETIPEEPKEPPPSKTPPTKPKRTKKPQLRVVPT